MKIQTILFLISFLNFSHSHLAVASSARILPPDLPPDASTEMLEKAVSKMNILALRMASTPEIDAMVRVGQRNLEWLKHINSFLPLDQKLSFTSKETQGGIPIDVPKEYSPETIAKSLEEFRNTLPESMKKVIYDNVSFTDRAPIAVEEYLDWGRRTDKAYQTALRWLTMEPYLSYLAQRRAQDIRGIYFLKKLSDVDRRVKLTTPKSWSESEAANMNTWFISLCMNNGSNLNSCRSIVNNAINTNQNMNVFYDRWQLRAITLYNSFFTIPDYAARNDVRFYNNNPQLFSIPFLTPDSDEVLHFLQDNIEDEWRFGNWSLKLSFENDAAAHVVFEAGATPHVDGLGGDTITMNAEQPLTEYDAQWTIRHEFGHVLGLPDCYVEFYDAEKRAIFNYQIDIDNLMCSRRGHIQQLHVDELTRIYLQK